MRRPSAAVGDLAKLWMLGHLFFWEDPGAFAAAVTSFLRDEDGGR